MLRLKPEGRALHDPTYGPLAEIGEAEQAVALGASVPSGKLRIRAPIIPEIEAMTLGSLQGGDNRV